MATITEIVTSVVTQTGTSPATASSTNRAPPQAGIIEGSNPTQYNPRDPIILFIIQAGIIIIFCRLLHYPLSRIRQPRVIAEVIGGILLGPSVMGRIPNFTDTIFPQASITNLNLIANLGLVLFLFLVGLEVDLRFLFSNWRQAVAVGLAGMALPFGLGCAIAWGLYNEFSNEPGTVHIQFGTFMLFIGVAMAITAFPVLCRILTELKLLSTPVGIIVLSAGVGNDVVGWILLALCVALVNAGTGITALYVLLTCVAYALFLVYAIRPIFLWTLRRSNALTDGPSQGIIVLTLLIALGSSFFTGVIGVHAIFGAFMAGLICPHEGGFAIKVTEKIEDLIGALFLPLYFALSGLNTDVGLLDNGITWAYTIGVICVAFFAKFIGAAVAARFSGLVWRESFAIGALMSCKGLVELIVLNIGLQARILSTRTFTIFVVMALVTTFATTPLTAAIYPPWYQRKLEAWKRGEIDWETGKPHDSSDGDAEVVQAKLQSNKMKNLMVYLRLDSMPTLLAFVSLLGGKPSSSETRTHPSRPKSSAADEDEVIRSESMDNPRKNTVQIHGVRLLELTDRGSSVMKVSDVDEFSLFDPVLNAFRVLAQVYNMAVSGEVNIAPVSSYPDILANKAADEGSDLLLLPWSETGGLTEAQTISNDSVKDKISSAAYTQFISQALVRATCNTAVFINNGFSGTLKQRPSTLSRSMSALSLRRHSEFQTQPRTDRSHHIFFPYLGGADARVALRLVLQLAENPEVTATIIHFTSPAHDQTVTPAKGSATAPAWAASASAQADSDAAFFASMRGSLPAEQAERVHFDTVAASSLTSSPSALHDAILEKAGQEAGQNPKNGGDIIVVGRGVVAGWAGMVPATPASPTSPGQASFTGDAGGESGGVGAEGCLGGLAAKVLEATGVRASLLVVQASSV